MPNSRFSLGRCLLNRGDWSDGRRFFVFPFALLFGFIAISDSRGSATPPQVRSTPLLSQDLSKADLSKADLPIARSLAELRALQSKYGKLRYEVDLVANLEFAATEWPVFFVGDGDEHAIIECHPSVSDALKDLPIGNRIQLNGRMLAEKPQIQMRSFRVLPGVRVLRPHKLGAYGPVALPNTASFVEIECVVEQVLSSTEKSVFLGRHGAVKIEIILYRELPRSVLLPLIGKNLVAQGTLAFEKPASGKTTGNGMLLHAMHPSQLQVRGTETVELQSLESKDIENFEKLLGQVLFTDSREQLIVRCDGRNLEVGTDFASDVSLGQSVSFYRRVHPTKPNDLRFNAELIVAGEVGKLPLNENVEMSKALESENTGARIQFSATVEQVETCRDGFLLQFSSNGATLVAKLNSTKTKRRELNFRVGDIVQVRGVPLRGDTVNAIPGHALMLFIDSETDIQVLFSPRPWRTHHFVVIALAGMGIVGIALVWNFALRRTVLSRTAELHDSSLNWRKTIEAISKGVVLTDENLRIKVFNQNFVKMFGHCPRMGCVIDELIRHISTMVQNKQEVFSAEVYAKSNARTSNKWLLELNNSERTISMTSSPLLGHDGQEFRGSLWSFEDVSENIRLEAELVQTQRMDAVGQLSGGIAHDFNNLLTIIRGSVTLLRDFSENVPQRTELLDAADTAVDRAAELTQHLLDISRRSTLTRSRVDLNDFLSKSFSLIRRSIDSTHEVTLELSSKEIPVEIDATRLEQVLINLCVNARDALPASHGKIVVKSETRVGDDGCSLAVLSVQDNGHGIPNEIVERIFEPFFTTKPIGAGTGLGLSMAHGIVEQHGGRISFKTTVGKGTRFEISIPISAISPQDSAPGQSGRLPNGRSIKILLVDDEELIRSTGRTILESLGHFVTAATNGKEAIDTLNENSFDLVILDLTMPVMSGQDSFVQIRAIWPDLPIVVCSGYPVDFFSWASGLSDKPLLLRKPFSRNDLVQIINAVASEQNSQLS